MYWGVVSPVLDVKVAFIWLDISGSPSAPLFVILYLKCIPLFEKCFCAVVFGLSDVVFSCLVVTYVVY